MGDLMKAGMQTVNSLCEFLQVTVNRDGRQFQQDYIRGIAQHDLRMSSASHPSGTEIVLRPDKAIFGDTGFSEEAISHWMKERSAGIENLNSHVCRVAE
jgi:DNA gyrase/topoisomerase IV subunit B